MRSQFLRLNLPLPPSSNTHWKKWRGNIVLSPEAEKFRGDVEKIVSAAQPPILKRDTKWRIKATAHLPNWKRDLGNIEKELMDALSPALGLNDRYVVECHLLRGENDKDNPRVEVELSW